ncbi:hypothetical protein GQ44DRAFT_774315 [Phaeosphaeriaceae sp. PMI808]|nr:hypothetical protein GQ44DRAFT_774315 [Phaeosphaeriaceae sp. PMI808]
MKNLPDEIILHIVAYLEPAELVKLQYVSHQLLNLSRDNNLWRTLCFSHSITERRRRHLEATSDIDPRLAELIDAANNISNAFDRSVHNPHAPSATVQQERNREKRWEALRTNWDPSYPDEKVNWYQDFIQRHAPQRMSWFQDAGDGGKDEDEVRHEATGSGILFNSDGFADKLVAPLDDGSISIWDANASSERRGRVIAKSNVGLLSNRGPGLDHDTIISQSCSIMTETGAVECVSIDSKLQKAFFAVQNNLNEVDLNTLQVVSRTPYPFPITALSEAHHRTPLTVGTNGTVHLHDPRQPPPTAPPSTQYELIGGPDPSFSRLQTGDFATHHTLSQPGALSILHLPTARDWDGNGDIWVAGRFTSLLNFDRRFFPRLRGTVHSGARISCLSSIPYPFIPQSLRTSYPAAHLAAAKLTPAHTLVAAGEYRGKGSLELYSLSSDPRRAILSTDNRTTRNAQSLYLNRQTAGRSKLLSVAPHGTRLVFSDGDGNLKWVERDGTTPVRQLNISDFETRGKGISAHTPPNDGEGDDDIVQKILPSRRIAAAGDNMFCSRSQAELGQDDLVGTIHAGQPKGTEEPLHNLNTYIVGNRTNPSAIIVIYSDIFGLALPNNKLIADAYAASGKYLVYLPDFFQGDPVRLAFADALIPVDAAKQSTLAKYTGILAGMPSFLLWMTRHKAGPTNDICMTFLEKLRRSTSASGIKIGMAGFCWGGRYAIRAGLEEHAIEIEGTKTPLVDAIVALHPSNMCVPEDVAGLLVPTSYGWGVEDVAVSFETKAKIERVHADAAGKAGGRKVPEMEHKVYEPGRHGFAVRGNPDDAAERKCLEDSEAQVLEWFGRWL